MNTAQNISLIVAGVLVIWSIGSYWVIRGVEQPKYSVKKSSTTYELREYDAYLVAETTVENNYKEALNQGFLKIADYIFGNNSSQEEIAMTAPVVSEQTPQKGEEIAMTAPVISEESEDGKAYTIGFIMPSKYSLETIPKPNNPEVKLREQSSQTIAVLSFSWYAGEERVKKKQEFLLKSLDEDGYEILSRPRLAQYNPPLSAPWMRRNEIQVVVNQKN